MSRSISLTLVALLTACSGEASLFVDLKTDFVPGAEFVTVRTTLDGEPLAERDAAYTDDYLAAVRVAERDALEGGGHELLVELLRGDGTLLVDRRYLLDLQGPLVLTALLTRDCRDVRCPEAQTCLAGGCVSAECVEAGDPGCPTPECATADDCPASMAACASATCDEGACLYAGVCMEGLYCSPERDCLPLPGAVPPLDSFSASPPESGLEGEVRLTWALPAEAAGADRLEIRRAPGDAAPADCEAGELAASLTDFATVLETVDRITDRWNRTHGYRACLYGQDGDVTTGDSMISEGVRYYNPAPGCQQPPCANAGSTSVATGLPTRSPTALTATGSSGGDIALGDVDDDDDLDVLVATDGVNVVHHNLGDGTFDAGSALGTDAAASMGTTVGDFDNDGDLDVVFANRDAPSLIHLGDGGGGFDDGTPIDPGSFPAVFDVEAADLDMDGDLDLIVTSFAELDRVYLGGGDGTFTYLGDLQPMAYESCVNCLQIQYVNQDFVPDVVLAYNTGADRLNIFLGDGDATFAPPTSIPYGSLTPISVRLADLDGDDLLDVLVGRSLGGAIYRGIGDGDGGFTPLTALSTNTNSRVYGLYAADFDGDGDVDVVFSQDNNGVIGYLDGNGDGTFGPQVDLDGGSTYTTTSIDAGDLDGDGLYDFVVGGAGGSLVFLGQ